MLNSSCIYVMNTLYKIYFISYIVLMKKFMDPKTLRSIAWVLLIIGGLNRGLL